MFDASTLPKPLLYAVLGLGLVHVLALLVAGLRRTAAPPGGRAAGNRSEPGAERDGNGDAEPGRATDRGEGPTLPRRSTSTVTCPHCGTVNELGYRFCRDCIGDLPGADGRAATGGSVLRGNPL